MRHLNRWGISSLLLLKGLTSQILTYAAVSSARPCDSPNFTRPSKIGPLFSARFRGVRNEIKRLLLGSVLVKYTHERRLADLPDGNSPLEAHFLPASAAVERLPHTQGRTSRQAQTKSTAGTPWADSSAQSEVSESHRNGDGGAADNSLQRKGEGTAAPSGTTKKHPCRNARRRVSRKSFTTKRAYNTDQPCVHGEEGTSSTAAADLCLEVVNERSLMSSALSSYGSNDSAPTSGTFAAWKTSSDGGEAARGEGCSCDWRDEWGDQNEEESQLTSALTPSRANAVKSGSRGKPLASLVALYSKENGRQPVERHSRKRSVRQEAENRKRKVHGESSSGKNVKDARSALASEGQRPHRLGSLQHALLEQSLLQTEDARYPKGEGLDVPPLMPLVITRAHRTWTVQAKRPKIMGGSQTQSDFVDKHPDLLSHNSANGCNTQSSEIRPGDTKRTQPLVHSEAAAAENSSEKSGEEETSEGTRRGRYKTRVEKVLRQGVTARGSLLTALKPNLVDWFKTNKVLPKGDVKAATAKLSETVKSYVSDYNAWMKKQRMWLEEKPRRSMQLQKRHTPASLEQGLEEKPRRSMQLQKRHTPASLDQELWENIVKQNERKWPWMKGEQAERKKHVVVLRAPSEASAAKKARPPFTQAVLTREFEPRDISQGDNQAERTRTPRKRSSSSSSVQCPPLTEARAESATVKRVSHAQRFVERQNTLYRSESERQGPNEHPMMQGISGMRLHLKQKLQPAGAQQRLQQLEPTDGGKSAGLLDEQHLLPQRLTSLTFLDHRNASTAGQSNLLVFESKRRLPEFFEPASAPQQRRPFKPSKYVPFLQSGSVETSPYGRGQRQPQALSQPAPPAQSKTSPRLPGRDHRPVIQSSLSQEAVLSLHEGMHMAENQTDGEYGKGPVSPLHARQPNRPVLVVPSTLQQRLGGVDRPPPKRSKWQEVHSTRAEPALPAEDTVGVPSVASSCSRSTEGQRQLRPRLMDSRHIRALHRKDDEYRWQLLNYIRSTPTMLQLPQLYPSLRSLAESSIEDYAATFEEALAFVEEEMQKAKNGKDSGAPA